jgi:hypothetical protein
VYHQPHSACLPTFPPVAHAAEACVPSISTLTVSSWFVIDAEGRTACKVREVGVKAAILNSKRPCVSFFNAVVVLKWHSEG